MKTSIETITPAIAEELMRRNDRNRKISTLRVNQYATDMVNGKWMINGSAISIDANGKLLDGQHRLAACIKAGIPFTTVVVTGLSQECMLTIDSGRARSYGDTLKIDGVPHSRNVAAAVRRAYTLETNGLEAAVTNRNYTVTHSQLQAFQNDHPELVELAQMTSSRDTSSSFLGMTLSLLTLLKWAIGNATTPERRDAFFARLCDKNMGNCEENPIDACRVQLWGMAASRKSGAKASEKVQAALVIKAWNKHVMGERCKLLKFTEKGNHPESFPEILEWRY